MAPVFEKRSDDDWTLTKDRLPPEGVLILARQTNPAFVQQLRRWGDRWVYPDGTGRTQYVPDEWRLADE